MSDTVVRAPLSRLPQTLYQLYTNQLAYWDTQVTALRTQLTSLMSSAVESYGFSGGQGQQSAKRRNLREVQEALTYAERQYGYYWKRLNGYGNVNMTLRRR